MTEKAKQSYGTLKLVSTPIGNLQDLTLRALDTIRTADIIAAEDTRRTRKLLSAFDINKKLISCHAHNEKNSVKGIIKLIKEEGLNVAVVSDAGTPSISDPGFLLVRESLKAGIEPEIIPGVSALTFAATASGLPVDSFSFFGFPPVKKGKRKKLLEQIKIESRTAILFESPYRINKLLNEIVEEIGQDTAVSIIREATKIHQEISRGTAMELAEEFNERTWKGEIALCVHPHHIFE